MKGQTCAQKKKVGLYMIAEKVAELAVSSCAMRAKILAVPPFKKKKKKYIQRDFSWITKA